MLGAIIGDVCGSIYEFESDKIKTFPFFQQGCRATDDSMMTMAVGCALVSSDYHNKDDFQEKLCRYMREIGTAHPNAGYGYKFYHWLMDKKRGPYNSFGNGSAMRVSPVAWVAKTLEEAETLAKWSAEVTHNHEEGIKGAQAISACIFLAREGKSKEEIRKYIEDNYYTLNFTLDEIRPSYKFNVTCQGSVPQGITCFLESTDFEDAVRNAISLGGDGDTIGAMAGAIAEAYYGIPDHLAEEVFDYIDEDLIDYYNEYAEEIYKGEC